MSGSYLRTCKLDVDDSSPPRLLGAEFYLCYAGAGHSRRRTSFTLGTAGGDVTNFISGSLTGSLVVGHTYRWIWNAFIEAPDADDGATATGNLTLTIHETIPEPTTLALFGLGLAGLGFVRRRKAA